MTSTGWRPELGTAWRAERSQASTAAGDAVSGTTLATSAATQSVVAARPIAATGRTGRSEVDVRMTEV